MPDYFFKSKDGLFTLYKGDCNFVLPELNTKFDLIFADPPYFLSSGGNTIHSGKIVSVDKGSWDKSLILREIYNFNYNWLKTIKEYLKNDGSIWISGTRHNIFTVLQGLDELDYKILNVITWEKSNPPPNFNIKILNSLLSL